MKAINPSGSRVNLGPNDSLTAVLSLIDSPNLSVFQFDERVPTSLLEGLNAEFFTRRPDVELRAYGFYGKICDLSFCSLLPNLQRFRADCLMNADGVEFLGGMPRLKSLGIGIWNLTDFAFLNDLNDKIAALFLSQTKSKKPDIAPIGRFKGLEMLYLEGQQKNIEVLTGLHELQDLTLRSITLDSLEMIRPLPKLRSLDLKLGGTRNLSAIAGMETLKYLELWKILGLDNIEVISSLTGLESLFLQSLIRISTLPRLDNLTKLRKICLEDMKGLTDISALASAPVLEELRHISSRLPIEDYLSLLEHGTLKEAHVGFGSLTKNGKFREQCLLRNIAYDVKYK
jgi:hypothetical protein